MSNLLKMTEQEMQNLNKEELVSMLLSAQISIEFMRDEIYYLRDERSALVKERKELLDENNKFYRLLNK